MHLLIMDSQDLAAINASLSTKVAELEVALTAAAAHASRGSGAWGSGSVDGSLSMVLGGSVVDPLGEKAKELRRQVCACVCAWVGEMKI